MAMRWYSIEEESFGGEDGLPFYGVSATMGSSLEKVVGRLLGERDGGVVEVLADGASVAWPDGEGGDLVRMVVRVYSEEERIADGLPDPMARPYDR